MVATIPQEDAAWEFVIELLKDKLMQAKEQELYADLDRAALLARIQRASERGDPIITPVYGGSAAQLTAVAEQKFSHAREYLATV